jgi:hypothetical protein
VFSRTLIRDKSTEESQGQEVLDNGSDRAVGPKAHGRIVWVYFSFFLFLSWSEWHIDNLQVHMIIVAQFDKYWVVEYHEELKVVQIIVHLDCQL